MKYYRLERQANQDRQRAAKKRSQARETDRLRDKRKRELSKLHSDRRSGILAGRLNPKEIYTKERRMRLLEKDITRLKKEAAGFNKEAEVFELAAKKLQDLANKARYSRA